MITIVERPVELGGVSLAPVFASGTFTSPIFSDATGSGGGGSSGGGTGTGNNNGGVVIEVSLADDETGSGGSFAFQLPFNFTGCTDAGSCAGVPDSVFNANFAAAN